MEIRVFFSSEFSNTDRVKEEEVLNTALAFGFNRQHVEEAIKEISKPNEELKTDDVLGWLQAKYPL